MGLCSSRSHSTQCAERGAQLFGKQLRLFPGGEVAASSGFVGRGYAVVEEAASDVVASATPWGMTNPGATTT
jgi:hypothetical protein